MICENCRSQFRAIARTVSVGSGHGPASRRIACAATLTAKRSLNQSKEHFKDGARRSFSSTESRGIMEKIDKAIIQPYRVLGATDRLAKLCMAPANYRITEQERKNDEVRKLDDGEEIGTPVHKDNVWHKTFALPPSFSTWSHVTMLHLYLLHARIRCFERDDYRNWTAQLADQFFFECERKMHVDHNIRSSALRQRYLKDVFIQWRGLIVACDEGVFKGDAILASALWRNLFKGAPDVDPRVLVTIVGWMRSNLRSLEATSDLNLPLRAEEILKTPVDKFWKRLEGPLSGDSGDAVGLKSPSSSAAAGVTPGAADVGAAADEDGSASARARAAAKEKAAALS